jgi:hypothetical protein
MANIDGIIHIPVLKPSLGALITMNLKESLRLWKKHDECVTAVDTGYRRVEGSYCCMGLPDER